MRLSTSTGGIATKLGLLEALRAIKNAGFDAYDFSLRPLTKTPDSPLMRDNYLDFLQEVKQTADEVGLVCNQAHATFPPEKYGDEEYNKATFARIVREIEAAAYVGAPCIVVHAVKPLPKGVDAWAGNLRFYRSLIPYCEKYNIKIALESSHAKFREDGVLKVYQHSAQNFIDIIKEVDSPYIVALIDTGHAAGNGMGLKPEDYIANMGGDIIAGLHIQDSDYLHDNHTTPFFQYLNWEEIMKALSDIGYKGDFTYEDVNVRRFFPQELTVNTLKYRARVARYLVDIFNKYEKEKGRL